MNVSGTLAKLRKSGAGAGDLSGAVLSDEAVAWNKAVREAPDVDELVQVLEGIKAKVRAGLDESGSLLDKVCLGVLLIPRAFVRSNTNARICVPGTALDGLRASLHL